MSPKTRQDIRFEQYSTFSAKISNIAYKMPNTPFKIQDTSKKLQETLSKILKTAYPKYQPGDIWPDGKPPPPQLYIIQNPKYTIQNPKKRQPKYEIPNRWHMTR